MKLKKPILVSKIATADLTQEHNEAIPLIAGEEMKIIITQERYQELLDAETKANSKPRTPQDDLQDLIGQGKKLYKKFEPEVNGFLKNLAKDFQSMNTHGSRPTTSSDETKEETGTEDQGKTKSQGSGRGRGGKTH